MRKYVHLSTLNLLSHTVQYMYSHMTSVISQLQHNFHGFVARSIVGTQRFISWDNEIYNGKTVKHNEKYCHVATE